MDNNNKVIEYVLDNKTIITIPIKEINNLMNQLSLSCDEAIQLWLEDHDEFVENGNSYLGEGI